MPLDIGTLLRTLNDAMKASNESTTRAEALISLLIEKGLLTEAELEERVKRQVELNRKLADAAASFDVGKES